MAPLVTIALPAFNAQATIRGAVRSALAQTVGTIEVVVVDDGSTDRTAGLVAELAAADPRLRLVRHPRRQGPAAARNSALLVARGTWFCCLEAGDRMAPGRLAGLLAAAGRWQVDLVADNLLCRDPGSGAVLGAVPGSARPIFRDATDFVRNDLPGGRRFRFAALKPLVRTALLHRHGIRYPTHLAAPTDLATDAEFHFWVECLLHGAELLLLPEAGYETPHPGLAPGAAPPAAADPGAVVGRAGPPPPEAWLRTNQALVDLALALGERGVAEALRERARKIGLIHARRHRVGPALALLARHLELLPTFATRLAAATVPTGRRWRKPGRLGAG